MTRYSSKSKKQIIEDTDAARYTIIRRKVKYPRIEFKTGKPIIILPQGYKNGAEFIRRHRMWVERKQNFVTEMERKVNANKIIKKRTKAVFESLVNTAIINSCRVLNVKVGRISFQRMKSKWASCSSEGNLMLNTLLLYLPAHLVNYVIFHEIVHVTERKHNERFWRIIAQRYPNHQYHENELFGYWFAINDYLTGQNKNNHTENAIKKKKTLTKSPDTRNQQPGRILGRVGKSTLGQ